MAAIKNLKLRTDNNISNIKQYIKGATNSQRTFMVTPNH